MGLILAVLAAVTLAIEIQTLTFYLMAIAAAFAVGSALAFMGFATTVVLGGVAVAALVSLPVAHFLRRRLLKPTAGTRQLEAEDTGQLVRVETVLPEGFRVEYRGTTWGAKLLELPVDPVQPGDLLRIAGRQGNTLQLAPLDTHRTTPE
ncbi:MAG: hypothetical protein B7Z66_11160 [Chromatiales bacterium 21-64-14]|nr:MAG: hypothetical protein B7Z66_11160 [Chromatiales bacterium 21-64-14]HQU16786.1 NfeD family protein [Gammaproteobacteria bacterium]